MKIAIQGRVAEVLGEGVGTWCIGRHGAIAMTVILLTAGAAVGEMTPVVELL